MFEDDIEDNCLIENEWDRESTDRNKYEKKYQEAKIDYEKRLKDYEDKYGKVSEGENFEVIFFIFIYFLIQKDDPKLPREPKTAYEMFTDEFYKQKMLIKIWNREDYIRDEYLENYEDAKEKYKKRLRKYEAKYGKIQKRRYSSSDEDDSDDDQDEDNNSYKNSSEDDQEDQSGDDDDKDEDNSDNRRNSNDPDDNEDDDLANSV